MVSLSVTAFHGNLFKPMRLQVKSNWQTDVLDKLASICVKIEMKLQGAMDSISQACDSYNLTISMKNA